MVEAEKAKILDVHFKAAGTDGVSLMMGAFRRAFGLVGLEYHAAAHDVLPTSGDLQISGLNYQTAELAQQRQLIFNGKASIERISPEEDVVKLLQAELTENKQPIFDQVKQYILENKISCVIIRNIFSLPLNLPATLALYDLILDPELEAAGVKFTLIHHDFYWEPSRSSNYETNFQFITDLLTTYFPPSIQNPRLVQFVINSLMQAEIHKRYGLPTSVLPDMDNFSEEELTAEKETLTLREQLNIGENDLMVVMPTRVVPRKAIEFAIGYVAHLQSPEHRQSLEQIGAELGVGEVQRKFDHNSKIYLVLPQGEDLADSQEYADALAALAKENNVELVFAGEHVRPDSLQAGDQDQRVTFFSVYGEADLVIYPTVAEGFGNQLLEIVKKKSFPFFLNMKSLSKTLNHICHTMSLWVILGSGRQIRS